MDIELYKNNKFLDKGKCAKCYLLDNGNVLKLFNNPRELYEIDRFKYFLNYDNDSCVFPFEFIYDNKKFYGYIMRYEKGKTLNEAFNKSNLLNLSTNSYKLEKNIDFLSEGSIELLDFHSENILYDGDKYSIIDFDETSIYRPKDIVKENNRSHHRIMIGNLFQRNIPNTKDTKLLIDRINKYKYMKIFPSEMIVQVKEDLEKEFKENIDTIDDLNKIIKGR